MAFEEVKVTEFTTPTPNVTLAVKVVVAPTAILTGSGTITTVQDGAGVGVGVIVGVGVLVGVLVGGGVERMRYMHR